MDPAVTATSTPPAGSAAPAETTTAPQKTTLANADRKGRVRTGCLVCRARKIKCDEQRPCCQRCVRSNKDCIYRPTHRRGWLLEPARPIEEQARIESHVPMQQIEEGGQLVQEQPHSSPNLRTPTTPDGAQPRIQPAVQRDMSEQGTEDSSPDSLLHATEPSATRFQMASRVIYLTLNMDTMAVSEGQAQPSFSYFILEVDSPFITPFEHLNWTRMKEHIAHLGTREVLVTKSLIALQALYRAQMDRLPTASTTSLHRAAIDVFHSALADESDFALILVAAFLLCLFKLTLPNEDGPTLDIFSGPFTTRLEAWLLHSTPSPVSLRIGAWLQLLNTAAKRGGSPSLLPESVSTLLCQHITEVPALSILDHETYPANSLYDSISAPLFTFYVHVQRVSNGVASVSHYHRSRITPADQAEVDKIMDGLRLKLYSLWESRPGPLRLQPDELREHFCHSIADPLVAFTRLCSAAYFAELISIGRILGYPSFPSPEAEKAKKNIRDIVSSDWDNSTQHELQPGYLRPLILYGIESFEREGAQWAADRLRQIKNPLSRGGFFASFVEMHGEEQRKQQRRVTTKYFCCQTFGVPLPFF